MNRASTRRIAKRYHGVIRDGNKVVWECDHSHKNRDQTNAWARLSGYGNGEQKRLSARDCAQYELDRRAEASIYEYEGEYRVRTDDVLLDGDYELRRKS